jgi:hypothetical protein
MELVLYCTESLQIWIFNMKKLLLIFGFTILGFNFLESKPEPKQQATQAPANQTPIEATEIPFTSILSPTFVIGDIMFISDALKSVEIKTTETEAYLMVDEKLNLIISNPQVKARPIEEAVLVDLDYITLKNIVLLMERAKFNAGNAIRYKRFIKSIKDAETAFVTKSNTK